MVGGLLGQDNARIGLPSYAFKAFSCSVGNPLVRVTGDV